MSHRLKWCALELPDLAKRLADDLHIHMQCFSGVFPLFPLEWRPLAEVWQRMQHRLVQWSRESQSRGTLPAGPGAG
jgi:hypothetical protein